VARQRRRSFASSGDSQNGQLHPHLPLRDFRSRARKRMKVRTGKNSMQTSQRALKRSSVWFVQFHLRDEPIKYECISHPSGTQLWATKSTAPMSSFTCVLLRRDGHLNSSNGYSCHVMHFIRRNWRSKASENGRVHYLWTLQNFLATLSDRRWASWRSPFLEFRRS